MDEKDKGSYALNTIGDILEYDPLRLLDLGNLFQLGASGGPGSILDNEEARATSNFEKLVEDKSRPLKHTLIDATRLLPDVITTLVGPGFASIKKAAKNKATKEATELGEKIAGKLVKERTEDAARNLTNSMFFNRDAKDMAGKAWLRRLWENKEAMNRIAGRNLTDEEITAVRNAIPKMVEPEFNKLNDKVDRLNGYINKAKREGIAEPLDLLEGLTNYSDTRALYKRVFELTDTELATFISNLKEAVENGKKLSSSHFNVERIVRGLPKEKAANILRTFGKNFTEFNKDMLNPIFSGAAAISQGAKAVDSLIDKKETENKSGEVTFSPLYFMEGAEPTPIKDFIASMFNMDFDDPARFNQEDIETFITFLENNKYIEPGSNEKLSPRQKVSVIRDIMKNKNIADKVKSDWLNSPERAEWY
jgi:hypothetical protein